MLNIGTADLEDLFQQLSPGVSTRHNGQLAEVIVPAGWLSRSVRGLSPLFARIGSGHHWFE